ncbi:MAG: Smr/MutS family protein [Alphaproteobacteria bacterium]|nr:Smr/MutS family protein [Alphaproteobacteria bacterium]
MASIDDEDWQELVKNVQPLNKDERDLSKPNKKIVVKEKITPNRVYGGEKLDGLEIGCADNIDANTFKRFKSGEMRVERELDLHGQTENEAYEKVINFVKSSYLRGLRCIDIITGKGLHAEDAPFFEARGVLKDRVPQWLNLPEIRPLILTMIHPEAKDGGSGVLRILLRRKRD